MLTFTTLKKHTYLVLCLLALFAASAFNQLFAQGGKPAADLDQIRNEGATTPLSPAAWVNGNAGNQTAHYRESHSIGYRLRMTKMPAGTQVVLTLGYDIRHSSRNAIDYLTHYERLLPHDQFQHPAENIDPTIETPYAGQEASPTSTFLIPKPSSLGSPQAGVPGSSWQALHDANPNQLKMTMWGGTITNIQYVTPQGDLNIAQSETRIIVTFTTNASFPNNPNNLVLLAWGGHIADRNEWGFDANGVPNSAGGISGSPYHMRTIGWSLNNLGNQDRSLSAQAVITCTVTPGTIGNPQTLCEGTSAAAFTNVTSGTVNTGNTLTYRWEEGTSCDGPWTPIANTNSATFDPDGSGTKAAGTYYYRRVAISSGTLNCEAPSNCVTLTVNAVDAGVIGSPQSECIGVNLAALTFTTAASGSGTLSYQWQQGTACDGTFSDISGATGTSFDPDAGGALAAGSYYYRVVVTSTLNGQACSENSNCVTVTVNGNPDPPSILVNDPNLCTLTAGSLQVCNPIAGTYSLSQTGKSFTDITFPNNDNKVEFTGLLFAAFNLTVTDVNGCVSDAADCDNVVTSCGTTARQAADTKEEAVKSTTPRVQDIEARILGKARVLAAPNPFTDKVRFTLQSDVSGQGSLEIYNTMGQKIHTVYQGYVEAGQTLVKEYNVPLSHRQSLIYIFKVGDQKTTGKLLNW